MEISSRIDYAISIASLVDGGRKNCTLRKSLTGKVSLCCGYRPRDVASGMEGGHDGRLPGNKQWEKGSFELLNFLEGCGIGVGKHC